MTDYELAHIQATFAGIVVQAAATLLAQGVNKPDVDTPTEAVTLVGELAEQAIEPSRRIVTLLLRQDA